MGHLPFHCPCRVAGVAALGVLPFWLVLPGSSPTRQARGGRFAGSSPTRQNCGLALATPLFKKRQPNGLTFEGTYTSERFLTSRSVSRGQWVYRRAMWELGKGGVG
jgi:hypothetical protein